MDLEALLKMKDETELVNALYSTGFEDKRLSRSKSARVEFLTTMRILKEYLKPGMKILDLGAGTGVYTVPLADMGYAVDAVELAEKNVALLKEKVTPSRRIRVHHQSAVDLSAFPSAEYDVVLVFGPLYHLKQAEDRSACIKEAMRVCRPDGVLLFAFISNDMVPLTECMYRDFFRPGAEATYDHETFQVDNFPFVFFTLDAMREMLAENSVKILREIASDGVSELLEKQINEMSDESYQEYLKYHFYCCEKPEMLGRSNHLLFVGEKKEPDSSGF